MSEGYRIMLKQRKARLEQTSLDDLLDGATTMEFLLRFTISHPNMTTTIVGTANPEHLAANVAAAQKGPLPADVYGAARERFEAG
jgi:aryl-alcohol dehydrogenase-like predicted oxidoreductase